MEDVTDAVASVPLTALFTSLNEEHHTPKAVLPWHISRIDRVAQKGETTKIDWLRDRSIRLLGLSVQGVSTVPFR